VVAGFHTGDEARAARLFGVGRETDAHLRSPSGGTWPPGRLNGAALTRSPPGGRAPPWPWRRRGWASRDRRKAGSADFPWPGNSPAVEREMEIVAMVLLAYAAGVIVSLVVSAARHPVRGDGTRW